MLTPKEMAYSAVRALDAKNGRDIRMLDTGALTSLADYFVLCTATSTTQIKTLSESVEKELKEQGELPHHIEGRRGGTWVLLDYASVVVHVFLDETRKFYDLEHLWRDAADVDISALLNQN